jgi:hypothetical protein
MRPKISLLIHTASPDDFLSGQGIPSAFWAVVQNLARQTFKYFELVYVDRYFERNAKVFRQWEGTFPVKHVPIHPAHRYWYDQNHLFICAAKNTGIIYADGELLITCDDAEIFPEHFLQAYWTYYMNEGRYLHPYHRRFRTIRTRMGKIVYPIEGAISASNARVPDEEVQRHENGGWLYAGTSFSLEHGLAINGFNERMDGTKSLEDCEFGIRLQRTGGKFVRDKDVWLAIIEHPSYMDNDNRQYFIAVENYGMIRCVTELGGLDAANLPDQIGERELKIIQHATIKYRYFDPLARENSSQLKKWLAVPSFNLREERLKLRRSEEWKRLLFHLRPRRMAQQRLRLAVNEHPR